MIYMRVINTIMYLAMIVVNVAAEMIPINGMTTGEISASYDSVFTPAGITFSIWFVIYAALAYFTIWQAFFAKDEMIKDIGWGFAFSCALNIAWMLLWHYKMLFVSTIAIITLMLSLYLIVGAVEEANWLVRAGFSIYLAWITIASIASVFLLIGQMSKGFAYSALAQGLVCVALLIALMMTFLRVKVYSDYAYAGAMIWAIAGIFYKHISTSGFAGKYLTISIAAGVAIAIIILMIVMEISKRKVEVITV